MSRSIHRSSRSSRTILAVGGAAALLTVAACSSGSSSPSGTAAAAAGGSDAHALMNEVPAPAGPGDEDDPAEEVSALYRRALELVRAEFEERTWQAFWLTAIEGREAPAAAAELGMSPVAVRIAKSRVLARLRAEAEELIG